MKKTALIFTAVTTGLSILGAVLHSSEIDMILDPASGLADRFAPISVCMTAVAILTLVLFSILALLVKGRDVQPVYHIAFASRTPIPLALSCLIGLAMIYGAYLCFRFGVGIRSSTRLVTILSAFSALSGVSCIVMSLMAYLKKSGIETMLCSFIMVLFYCLWLIVYYLEKSADPAMMSFVYDYLAICAAAVAGYYSAGYAYGRSRPRATLIASMAAAFFCVTAAPKALTLSFTIFFAAIGILNLVNVFVLTNNLQYKTDNAEEISDEMPETIPEEQE
ncbi:MAG: hypothetical protein IKT47_00375 [Oscillospiraceae bacterium]|nr:hypothetical protein [Oscillospiraceae bacterium]